MFAITVTVCVTVTVRQRWAEMRRSVATDPW